MRRAALLLLVTSTACVLLVAGARGAEYTPVALVSYIGSLQADDAYSPAISADGSYVAFVGSFNDVSGVYRKDLDTGELALVAGADSAEPGLSAPDAGAPSISADGRYVSFTTTARLDPTDDQPGDAGGCTSVYVRDMDVAAGEPGSYTLASALNGTTEGITYAGSTALAGDCPGGGSASADRVALSADGREVVFTVLGQSNLTTGVAGATSTPPDQVAVRDLETDTTTLVSQTLSSLGATPEAVPGGAALALPQSDLQSSDGRELSASSAAISADGSTVAWMGTNISEQAPTSSVLDASNAYAEPLWRRIAEGPDAPTRRVTGGDDPLCGCAGPLDTAFDPSASGNGGAGPEIGTYVAHDGFGGDPLAGGIPSLDSVTPQLSANGQIVAVLSTQPRTGEVSRALEEELTPSTANAFVVNMASGLTRSEALTQLTGWASDNFKNTSATGAIDSIAISPDGSKVAFTTTRVDFPLSPPTLVTPALSQASNTQLYVADLTAGSLTLVSYGYDGEPSNGSVATPSFADDGDTLAFASSATNLVYGAYNRGAEGVAGNVFVTSQIISPPVAGVSYIEAPPAAPAAVQRWEILLATHPEPNGSVLLYVTVPAGGSLQAVAKAEIPVTVTTAAKKGKHKKAKGATKARSAAAKRSQPARRSAVVARTVASAKADPTQAGLVELRLTSAKAYSALVDGHDGLYATVTVTFAAHGRPTLAGGTQVTFRHVATKRTSKRSARKAVKQ